MINPKRKLIAILIAVIPAIILILTTNVTKLVLPVFAALSIVMMTLWVFRKVYQWLTEHNIP